jgi:membrane fusion protein, copper/silver efflux system
VKKKRLISLVLGVVLCGLPALGLAQAHQHGASSERPKASPAKAAAKEAVQEEVPLVEIPADKRQLIGLKTSPVAVKPLQRIIRTVGRIEYDEKKITTINTKYEGWIEKLWVNYTGRVVKKGEPLAEIYSPELLATQREFLNALKWKNSTRKDGSLGDLLAKDADTILEAARQRLRLWDITEEQIKQVEETGKPIRSLTLYSPVSGHVVYKAAIQGMKVMPGEKLFDIVDLSTLWIIADIYEYELPEIRVGEQAAINLTYLPGKELLSRIDYVYPTLSGETRTNKVRFVIDNSSGQLKPQMFTNVTLRISLGKRLVVPEDAIIDTGTRQIVYVDKGEGNFEPREVTIGLKGDNGIEIIRGLRAGEKVASSPNFLIDSEAKLKGIAPKSQNPGVRSQKPE